MDHHTEGDDPQRLPDDGRRQRDEVRMWGMLCHLSGIAWLVGGPFGGIIGPLVVWLVKREQDPFIDQQGKEALNFHISMFLWYTALGTVGLGSLLICPLLVVVIPLALVLVILDLVLSVMAALDANHGVSYRYPLTIRFLR